MLHGLLGDRKSLIQGTSMTREIITTKNAPAAIGTYSQAVRIDGIIYISGQIPLDPNTMDIVSTEIREQIIRVFDNLSAIAKAAGTTLDNVAKLNVYLTNLDHFPLINEVMAEYFQQPYPARAAIGVSQLPKNALIEMDAIIHLKD